MKKGFELLIAEKKYSLDVLKDFEKVLGPIPESYRKFLMSYKTGYPSINKNEGAEVYIRRGAQDELFLIESFLTLPDSMDRLYSLDRTFGLSGNHRKFKLLPICTSGSSYRVYFLKMDTGEIIYLNPNEDLDRQIEISEFTLSQDVFEFVGMFASYMP